MNCVVLHRRVMNTTQFVKEAPFIHMVQNLSIDLLQSSRKPNQRHFCLVQFPHCRQYKNALKFSPTDKYALLKEVNRLYRLPISTSQTFALAPFLPIGKPVKNIWVPKLISVTLLFIDTGKSGAYTFPAEAHFEKCYLELCLLKNFVFIPKLASINSILLRAVRFGIQSKRIPNITSRIKRTFPVGYSPLKLIKLYFNITSFKDKADHYLEEFKLPGLKRIVSLMSFRPTKRVYYAVHYLFTLPHIYIQTRHQ